MFMPAKYQPDYMFLRNVPMRRVHLFTFIQIICLTVLCVIKEIGVISIMFPVMVSEHDTCQSVIIIIVITIVVVVIIGIFNVA